MSFAAYFKLTSYVLIASGFLAAAATGEFNPFVLAACGAVFIASWFADTARLRKAFPAWARRVAPAALLVAFGVDFTLLSRSIPLSAVHVLLPAAALKLLTRSRDRDFLALYLCSFAALLSAAALTISPAFLGSLLLFFASGTGAFVLYEMKRSCAAAQREGGIRPAVVTRAVCGPGYELFAGFPARTMALTTLALTLSIVMVAVPLFFLLPRISLGISHHPSGRPQFLSGFSERVTLGEIGTIKQSNTLVMKVMVDAPPEHLPPDLKWRGIALDRFNGKAWDCTVAPDHLGIPTQGGYFKLRQYARGTDIHVQTFFAEPVAPDLVFGSNLMLAVSSDLGWLERDALDNVYALAPRTSASRYTVVSDITRPDPRLLASLPVDLPESVRASCLSLPRLDPRISQLAHQVTSGAAAPFDKARALEDYLRSNYGYSLDLKGTPNSADPLAVFLFGVRRGHCEYFATAMTVMLRQLGIPARLVNGFRAGEYNRLSHHWTVRQRDAHSWVEAYFPSFGWVEFDPTPGEPFRQPPLLAPAAMLFDALDLWWSDHVINYDMRGQASLVLGLRGAAWSARDRAAELARSAGRIGAQLGAVHPDRPLLLAAGLIVSLAAAALLVAFFLARRSPDLARRLRLAVGPARHGGDREVVVGLFREALELLKRKGLERHPSQTPLEFSAELAGRPFGEALAALTALYNRVRYGRAAEATDLARARHHLGELRHNLYGGNGSRPPGAAGGVKA